ncbi:hypothetical protein CY34DRAFT_813030 [Suillus luteus UH-Slu-Lm8-n1]|uniref:Uncharacterized protein n=1 Tax=Suillus luteus UH-Slu-Lm8-n1 TaxID=930992 RepID=A0A0C9Z9U6_9AGAM|nr:hypothetical protein CY34DRAFT_813030 [Suillus luteus UH-Slu-Lm8-n1]
MTSVGRSQYPPGQEYRPTINRTCAETIIILDFSLTRDYYEPQHCWPYHTGKPTISSRHGDEGHNLIHEWLAITRSKDYQEAFQFGRSMPDQPYTMPYRGGMLCAYRLPIIPASQAIVIKDRGSMTIQPLSKLDIQILQP